MELDSKGTVATGPLPGPAQPKHCSAGTSALDSTRLSLKYVGTLSLPGVITHLAFSEIHAVREEYL